jgi:hypothetical protein
LRRSQVSNGLRVPPLGAAGRPRRVERHAARHQVEPRHRLAEVGQRDGVHRRDRPAVGGRPSPRREQELALGVRRVRSAIPSSRASASSRCWLGPDPLGAELDDLVGRIADGSLSVRPPTRSRASSTTTERPAARERAGGGEARQPGADHGDVGLPHVSPS